MKNRIEELNTEESNAEAEDIRLFDVIRVSVEEGDYEGKSGYKYVFVTDIKCPDFDNIDDVDFDEEELVKTISGIEFQGDTIEVPGVEQAATFTRVFGLNEPVNRVGDALSIVVGKRYANEPEVTIKLGD